MRLIPVSREFLCKPAVSVQSDRIERLIFGVDSVDRDTQALTIQPTPHEAGSCIHRPQGRKLDHETFLRSD